MVKKYLRSFVLLSVLAIAMLTAPMVEAATPNYQIGNVEVLSFQLSGQYTTTTASVVKFALPFPAKLVGVTATARASGGTTPTLTVDVKNGGTSALSAPVSITAGTVAEATIVNSTLADESVMTVDLAIGGTSPTWNDITLLLTVVRR